MGGSEPFQKPCRAFSFMARRVCLAFSLDWYSSNSAMNLAFLAKAHTVDEPVLSSAEDYPRCLDSFFHLSHRLEPGLESLIRRLQPLHGDGREVGLFG